MVMSLRERAKQDKRERIRKAAIALFRKQGFERTTTKQIAAKAGIAAGTLFLYAPTKEEVLALAFGDEIDAVWADRAATLPPPEAGLVSRLLHMFDGVLGFLAKDRTLSRLLIKEMTFIGPEGADRATRTLMGVIGRVSALVAAAQARGEIDRTAPALLVATNLFAVYHFAMIGWLHRRFPDDAAFRTFFRASLELCLKGVQPGGRR